MAAGNYQVDLILINDAETTTGWVDINQAGGGGANSADPDFAIQGTNAITRQVSNTRRGVLYDFGSTVTLGADDHIYTWTVCSTPGIVENKSLGGIRVSIGTSTTAYYDFYANGGDTLPEGGMNNYVVYYAAASASLTNGSPGANPQFFGAQASTNATARNVNFACDVIRYGTGYYIFDGDSTNPITFASASQDNDLNVNRYGVFTSIPGGFSQKGRFVIGQTTASVPTQAYFNDSNTSITFADTEYAQTDFTQIIIDHPSTFANFRNISFTALGTKNPGQINFLDSSTVGYLDGCTFSSIGTTQLQAAVTASSTWFQSSTVNQSGSLINASRFNNTSAPTSALVSDRPDRVTNCTFTSPGTKHGIEVTAAGSYVFTGNTLTGYDSGSNANEFLYFNPTGGTGDLTLTVVSGNGTIEYRNDSSGTVTIVNSVTVTVTGLKDNTEVRVFEGTNSYPQTELAGIENVTDGTANDRTFSFSLEIGTVVDIVIHNTAYRYLKIEDFELTETQDLPVTQIFDRNFSNPGGETNFLSDAYFTSLAARSTFYENETESKIFAQSLESQGFWESASLVYVAAGYSSASIQSLVPSSSAGDMLIIDPGLFLRPAFPKYLSRVNNEGYVVTGSTGGVVPLNYSSTDIGKSGSFSTAIDVLAGATPFRYTGVSTQIFRNSSVTFSTGSNTVFTENASGITTPQGPVQGENNAARLTDDNSGGSKEVFYNQAIINAEVGNFQYTTFASSSGADWLYLSASFQGGSSVSWFNITTGEIGTTSGNLSDGVFNPQFFRNDWKRVGMNFQSLGIGSGSLTVGISDADNSKTVTADGNASMLVWGYNSPRLNGVGGANNKMVPFLFPKNTTSIPDVPLSSSLAGGALTEGTFYVEGSFSYTSMISGSGTFSDFAIGLVSSADKNERFIVEFNYGNLSFITCRANTSAGNTSTQFDTSVIGPDYFLEEKMAKVAIRIKDGDYRVSCNGTDAAFSPAELPPLDKLMVNVTADSSGRFKSIAVFDKAFTNAELNALTSY